MKEKKFTFLQSPNYRKYMCVQVCVYITYEAIARAGFDRNYFIQRNTVGENCVDEGR